MIRRSLIVDQRFPLPARRLERLVQQVLKVNQREAERAIHDGSVRVNGRAARRGSITLEIGDRLEVEYEPPPPPAEKTKAAREPMQVVFEDEHLIVVHKPAALLTVPTPHRERVTLLSIVEQHLRANGPRDAKAYCVQRLDRGVSGLLVFGKRLDVAEALRDQFAARKPERVYAAIVAGRVRDDSGTFRSHLATDADLNRYSTDDEESGQLAITHFRVLRRMPAATLVEVRLETGRRNQIRVHFAEAGHPVLGDPRYGGESPLWPHRRLALVAHTLGFTHPVLGTQLHYTIPLPREMSLT